MGDWLKLYGECIYGTKGGPILPTINYGATSTSKAVYIHVWEWPVDGKFTIEGLKGIKSGKPLTADNVSVSVKDGKVLLSCDKINTENPLMVIKLKI